MDTARVFRSGNSQSARLPKQFRLKARKWRSFGEGMRLFCAKKMETWCEPLTCRLICRDDIVIADREKDRPQRRKKL